MGNIVFIDKKRAIEKAGLEIFKIKEIIRRELSDYINLLLSKYFYEASQSITSLYAFFTSRFETLLEEIISKLNSQFQKFAIELCASPDIDLVLDSSVVYAADSANDMTEKFTNYLVENNRDSVLSLDNFRQKVKDEIKQWNWRINADLGYVCKEIPEFQPQF